MIQKLALAEQTPVRKLDAAHIQASLKATKHSASLFAIRTAQSHLVTTAASKQEDVGALALEAQGTKLDKAPVPSAPSPMAKGTAFSLLMASKSQKDVVVMGPLPKIEPGLLGADLVAEAVKPKPVPPQTRAALWGLDAVQAGPKMSRADWLEHVSSGMGDAGPFAKARYGAKGAAMLVDMRLLDDAFGASVKGDFTKLLVDPGLMSATHREAFCEFATKNKEKLAGKTPFQIRQAYADTLAPKTYYRAIKLPDTAADTIKDHTGMTSRVARSLGSYGDVGKRIRAQDKAVVETRELADAPLASALSQHIRPFSRASSMRPWSTTLPAEVKAPFMEKAAVELGLDVGTKDVRVKGRISSLAGKLYQQARAQDLNRLKDGDAFLSVSEDRRVALSVAADPEMAGSVKQGESVYLYTLKMSPLDVIDPGDYVGHDQSPSHVKFGTGPSEKYTGRIEGIVMPHIHTNEIASCEKLGYEACKQYKMELQWT